LFFKCVSFLKSCVVFFEENSSDARDEICLILSEDAVSEERRMRSHKTLTSEMLTGC